MLKLLVLVLLIAAIWYAFSYRPRGNWPPRDDRDDGQGGGPGPPVHRIDLDPAAPETDPEPASAGQDRDKV